MSLRKMFLPAALIAVIALLAPCANAQTMGEYATTTGAAAGGGSMGGSSFSLPAPSLGSSCPNGCSGTWGASRLGSSFEERAAAVSGSGMGADFESRAASLTSTSHAGESRWPGTGFSANSSENRFGASQDRFKTGDRFTSNDRFGSTADRFPKSAFSDHMGLDTKFNSVNGY
jgi:hypothetical protein